jgi:hypothetical protein
MHPLVRNINPWQVVKKRKRASNKIQITSGFWLDTSNQYQELQVEDHTGMEETPHSHTELETNNQQTKEPKPPPIYMSSARSAVPVHM